MHPITLYSIIVWLIAMAIYREYKHSLAVRTLEDKLSCTRTRFVNICRDYSDLWQSSKITRAERDAADRCLESLIDALNHKKATG